MAWPLQTCSPKRRRAERAASAAAADGVSARSMALVRGAVLSVGLLGLGVSSPDCDALHPRIYGELQLAEADLLLVGSQRNGQAGLSVALMGDINADGYDDILVGAPGEGQGGNAVGAAYLVYGPMAGLLDLREADARFEGYVPLGYVGRSVSSPGDVNGDGYDDVLIGSGTANEAYLFYGPVEGEVSCLDADVRFTGAGAGDRTGVAVAGIGDVNDDGYPDVAVGAPLADGSGLLDRGAVYIFWGGPGLAGVKSVLDAPLLLVGTQANEQAGTAVAGAGDLNGDGHQDLLVGSAGFSLSPESREGAVYVMYGPFDGGVFHLSDAVAQLVGEQSDDQAGSQLSSAGDVDRDGLDDFLVGARKNDSGGQDAGAAYLMYGADLQKGQGDLKQASVKFIGENPGDGAGFVSRGGDVNGDGFADLVIGASTHDAGWNDNGAAYLIYGPVLENPVHLEDAAARIIGVSAFDQAGYGVGGGGDVNHDGFHDIIVGALNGDGASADVGTAGVFLGGD